METSYLFFGAAIFLALLFLLKFLDKKLPNNIWYTIAKLTIGITLFAFLLPSLLTSKNWSSQMVLIMFTVGLLLQGYKLFRQFKNQSN